MTKIKLIDKIKNLEWNVIKYDVNIKDFEVINIFDYAHLFEKTFKQFIKDKDEKQFEINLKSDIQRQFWSRSEYEIELKPLFNDECKKVDIYTQIDMNWNRFFKYVLKEVENE